MRTKKKTRAPYGSVKRAKLEAAFAKTTAAPKPDFDAAVRHLEASADDIRRRIDYIQSQIEEEIQEVNTLREELASISQAVFALKSE